MFEYDILRYKWMIAAIGGGMVIMLAAVLTYLPIWGPRRSGERGDVGPGSRWRDSLRYVPAILVLTWIGSFVYGFVHALMMR